MKNILLPAMLLCTGFLACDKDCTADIPECIREWAELVKNEPTWNPSAEVKAYRYNGKTVYLMSANCCDQYFTLIDGQCNISVHLKAVFQVRVTESVLIFIVRGSL